MTPSSPVNTDVVSLLIERGAISVEEGNQARAREQRYQIPLHQAVVDLNLASEEDTYQTLASLQNLPFWPASNEDQVRTFLDEIPIKLLLLLSSM